MVFDLRRNDDLTLHELQQRIESSDYPNLYTEDQIKMLAGYLVADIPELQGYNIYDLANSISRGLSAIETPFNRMFYPLIHMFMAGALLFKHLLPVVDGKTTEIDVTQAECDVVDIQRYLILLANGMGASMDRLLRDNIKE
ncbi:MAG: hypothetical protein QXU32_02280 [Nitrososphaerales archaeon]